MPPVSPIIFLAMGVAMVDAARSTMLSKDARTVVAEAALADDIAVVVSGLSAQTGAKEPIVSADVAAEDISKEEGASKGKLIHAAQAFSAASTMWDADEEKVVDRALASAMESPSTLGRPDRTLPLLAKSA